MRRLLVPLAGTLTTLALITAPVVCALHEKGQMRNFRVVREGVFYRSAQMSLPGLKRAVHDYGIKTVISFRDADRTADQSEEDYCRKEEIAFQRLPPLSWDNSRGPAPVEENVRKFLALIDDAANAPVLVHCFAGVHRTGAYVAIYRMEKERWSNERAIAEMRACGYDTLDFDRDILEYLESYQPRWKRAP